MKFSIITVALNSEKTIARTIQSVLDQSHPDYEYIIVDGVSKDKTLDIVKSYAPKFGGKLKWISEPDTGLYNAMNKGLKLATGDIIGIVNSDDFLESNALETIEKIALANGFKNTDKFVISGAMKFHYADGSFQIRYNPSLDNLNALKMNLNHPATFVSQAAYKNIGLFDERLRIFADFDLLVRMYRGGVPFVLIDDVVTNMTDGGISNSHIDLKQTKIFFSKHVDNKFKANFLWSKLILRKFIRSLMPTKLLKVYRTKIKGDFSNK